MKVSLSLLCLTFVCFSLLAQSVEDRNIKGFDEIRAGEAIDVYLEQGNEEGVRVEARGVDASHVLTDLSGGTLKIHMSGGNYRNTDVNVYVTYKELSGVTATSASGVFSRSVIRSDDFEISVSSAANVELDLDVESLEVSVSSSGDVELSGRARRMQASVSSAGDINAYDLDCETVEVRSSSAGSAKVSASEEIEARATSGGSIRYRGNPARSNTDSSSGGSVRKSN